MNSETDDGLSSCSNFPERPTETEIASNKPVLPEIEHLKGKKIESGAGLAQSGVESECRCFFETEGRYGRRQFCRT